MFADREPAADFLLPVVPEALWKALTLIVSPLSSTLSALLSSTLLSPPVLPEFPPVADVLVDGEGVGML